MQRQGFAFFVLLTSCTTILGTNAENLKNQEMMQMAETVPGQFPFAVAFQLNPNHDLINSSSKKLKKDKALCGGALINETHVITSAHCADWINSTKFVEAVIGGWNLSDTNEKFRQRRKVNGIKLHPDWKFAPTPEFPLKSTANVALVSLEKPVVLSARVQPIRLSFNKEPSQQSSKCTLVAWRWRVFDVLTWPPFITLETLHEIKLRIINNTECGKRMVSFSPIDNTMLCAENVEAEELNTEICAGEDGGSIICEDKEGFYLAGIANFAHILCSHPSYAVVFTLTTHSSF